MFAENFKAKAKLLGSKEEITGYVVKFNARTYIVTDSRGKYDYQDYTEILCGCKEVDESTLELL